MGIISNLLFGDNSNKTSYKDAAYKKRYQDISNATYDSMYGGMEDYLDKNYAGGSSKYKYDYLEGLKNDADTARSNYNATKNNVFGNGIIGSVLNPIAQTAGAVGDLAGLGLSLGKNNAWAKDEVGINRRDVGSDLGALGETALTVLPMAMSMRAAKAGKAVQAGTATAKQKALYDASQAPKSTAQKVVGGALMGAGYGASGNLRDSGFENFDPGQFGLSALIVGTTGGALAGAGQLWNKYTSAKVPTTAADATPYQEALNNLKNSAGGGAMYSDVATNLPAVRGMDTARITLDNLDNKTLKKLFTSGIKNARTKAGGGFDVNKATSALTDNKRLLQDFLKDGMPKSSTYETVKAKNFGEALNNLKTNLGNTKAGTKVSNLLKTRKGKVAAGAGIGLILAKLLSGGNNNDMTDEEQQALYNYIIGEQ